MINNKYRLIKPFLPMILGGAGFLLFLLIVRPRFPILLLIIILSTFIITLYIGGSVRKSVEASLINGGILTAIHFLLVWLGGKGVLYVTLALILVPIIIIIRRWKLFIKTLGDIEQEFFGRRFK